METLKNSLPSTLVNSLGLNIVKISHPGCPCADFSSPLITAFIPASEVGVPPTWERTLSLRKYAQIYSLPIFRLSIAILKIQKKYYPYLISAQSFDLKNCKERT